jgi:hypothetical protein
MIETNIRLVEGGLALKLPVRRMQLTLTGHKDNAAEFACSILRGQHGLPAVVHPTDRLAIWVLSDRSVGVTSRRDSDWQLQIDDVGEQYSLGAGDEAEVRAIAMLLERALAVTLEKARRRWTLDSNRIWHEPEPWATDQGIAAYSRIAFSALPLSEVGLGVAADVHTAYFTADPLSWYFAGNLAHNEAERRAQLFKRLADREHGKGTLAYRVETNTVKAYFSRAQPGFTVSSPHESRIGGRTYATLLEYFAARYPRIRLDPQEPAIFVSFEGIGRPVPVPARFVRLRVFTDALPEKLQGSAAIVPEERKRLIDDFWVEVGARPFGSLVPGVSRHYWIPSGSERTWKVAGPRLLFGKGGQVEPRANGHGGASYYRDRLDALDRHGCYKAPATVGRTFICAYDERATNMNAVKELAAEVAKHLQRWLGFQFSIQYLPFKDPDDCQAKMERFRNAAGPMLCLIGRDDQSYFDVSLRLGGYRPKRVTLPTLYRHYQFLTEGVRRRDGADHAAGRRKWDSFAQLTSLDILQQIDGVPWVCDASQHDALLVIDVSRDRRYYGLALTVSRPSGGGVDFSFNTVVHPKLNVRRDAIDAAVLKKDVVELIRRRRGDEPLGSLLVIKDGRFYPEELEGVRQAELELGGTGLALGAVVDLVELHKDTMKELRMWQTNNGQTGNVEEGSAVRISAREILLANTGCLTLNQGTAEPVLLVAHRVQDMKRVAVSCHYASQLNWSSPRVAQRLPLGLSRIDNDLAERALRETRHLS